MLTAYAVSAAGASLAVIEKALLAQIHGLARGAIAAAEIDKVRSQLLTSALVRRQTPAGQAAAVGQALMLYGDVRQADRELPQLLAVTAADVRRVLQRHVLTRPRVSVNYVSEG